MCDAHACTQPGPASASCTRAPWAGQAAADNQRSCMITHTVSRSCSSQTIQGGPRCIKTTMHGCNPEADAHAQRRVQRHASRVCQPVFMWRSSDVHAAAIPLVPCTTWALVPCRSRWSARAQRVYIRTERSGCYGKPCRHSVVMSHQALKYIHDQILEIK